MTVIDASPSGLADHIVVYGEQVGYTVALKLPAVTYAKGEHVDVLFMKGTEPVAIPQKTTRADKWP